jgi:predicted unusual protein kinase regulating ubiquinone biosynthesis (AarF/ABC1/UbiB family)
VFLASTPSQEVRNEFARKMIRAWYRMHFVGRLTYADLHSGNFLFMDDGRLGLIDFGFVVTHNDEEWKLIHKIDRAMTTGRLEDRVAAIKEWSSITDDPADNDRLRLTEEYADWCWRCRYSGGPVDFSDEADFRRGIGLFTEMVRKRYSRSRPSTPSIARMNFGLRSLFYQLKAKIDIRPIAEEEVKATGWDRSDYA